MTIRKGTSACRQAKVDLILPVLVISENRCAVDPSNDDMMQGARGVDAGFAKHAFQILHSYLLVNDKTTPPSSPRNCTRNPTINRNKIVDTVTKNVTIQRMIKSFKHKGLGELFAAGRTHRVRSDLLR